MPLRLKFPSKDKKGQSPDQRRASSDVEDHGQMHRKCPKCSYNFSGSFRNSHDAGRPQDGSLPSLGFDFAPVPILLVSQTSVIESANKTAFTLFSHIAKLYGGLNGLHVGELGIEFPEQRWVTLAMVLEKRRAVFLDSPLNANSPVEATFKKSDVDDTSARDPSEIPSPRTPKHPQSSDITNFGRRAAEAMRFKQKAREPESESHAESFDIMIRFPTPSHLQRRDSNTKLPTRRIEDLEKQNFTLIPATLYLSFAEYGRDLYTAMSILTHDGTSLSNSKNSERTRELIVPGNMAMATELANQTERVRDAALEKLDTHFIAMSTRGDITVTNSSTREFFGLESSVPNIGIGRSTTDWISGLNIYDPKFSSSSPFQDYFLHSFRRKTTEVRDNVGVYVKDIPKLMEVSGTPLWAVNTPWVKDLDRELVGYLAMFRDVTKQKELETAHAQDEKLRGIFTSGVVAELRTPIAGIVGLLQILNETKLCEDQATHLMGLLRSVNYLLISIDDIVDFSSFEMRQSVVKAKPFNLYHLIHHVSNLAYLTFSKRDVQFTVDLDGLMPITKYKYEGAENDIEKPLHERMECIVIGDEWNAGRVLTNVLSNAFKYTSEGYVRLRVTIKDFKDTSCRMSFEVKDTGIGIAEEASKSIFKPFANNDETGRKPTDGLGLYVTQKTVKQLNGELDFFSTLGIGSVFKITFPFRRDENIVLSEISEKPNEDLLQATSAILQRDFSERRRTSNPLSLQLAESEEDEPLPTLETLTLSQNDQTVSAVTEPPTPPLDKHTEAISSDLPVLKHTPSSPPNSKTVSGDENLMLVDRPQYSPSPTMRVTDAKRENSRGSISDTKGASNDNSIKIMVVEDNWALQNIAKLRLEKLGCTPIIAPNGLDAIRLLGSRAAVPDFILMDLQMPLMDGYEATTAIRQVSEPNLKEFQDIPIIAVTASTMESDKEKAFKVGMSDYVYKPLGMNVLKELVAKYGRRQGPTSNPEASDLPETPSVK